MPRRIISIFLTIILILTLTACNGNAGGANKDFSYYLDSAVTSLDPQTAKGTDSMRVINAIFEGLCRLDANGRAVPGVAKVWISNPECTEYVFILRDDAKWDDGKPLVAQDFVYGMRRAVDPATKATGVDDLFNIKNAKNIYDGLQPLNDLGVEAPSDYILKITLEQGRKNLPEMTSTARFMPCREDFFVESAGRYGLEPDYLITNGPFEFYSSYSWDPGKSIKLSSAPNYYGEVKPAGLTFYFEKPAELSDDPVAALTGGSADILSLTKAEASKAADAGCKIYSFNNSVTGLIFNSSADYLSSPELREIFVKSIDRRNLLTDLPTDNTEAADIVPGSIMWESKAYRDAAEKGLYVKQDDSAVGKLPAALSALQLEVVPPVTITCPDDPLSMEIVNRIIVSWNKKMGSYFNILPLPADQYFNAIYTGSYQVALYTVSSSSDTPYSFLKSFESTASPQLLNSQAFDTLLHTAYTDISDFIGLEKFLNNQYIFYPILNDYSYYGMSTKVSNIKVYANNNIDFIDAVK